MSVGTTLGPPPLPVELEREILELAARSQPTSIPTLMLVAHYVKTWVEPLLYRTLFIFHRAVRGYPCVSEKTFQSVVKEKPASFLNDSVRHLFLSDMSDQDMAWLFTTCSQVENVFVVGRFDGKHPLASAAPLLKQLQCCLGPGMNFTHRSFSHLSHFWHYGNVGNPSIWTDLVLIPNLTHLAFNDSDFIPLFRGFLDTCESLLVLVYMEFGRMSPQPRELDVEVAKDHRFVSLDMPNYREDWLRGANTGFDFWSKADDFVARRKFGQVPGGQFALLGSYY
ncbi:hypothetical protein C8R43DRAFT_181074 [Mycena crocata]|nr:hypothetical protein C8R43DRAFT_181074 [Mycena crocata]